MLSILPWKRCVPVAKVWLQSSLCAGRRRLTSLLQNVPAAQSTICTGKTHLPMKCTSQQGMLMSHRYKSSYPPEPEFETPSPYKGNEIQHRYKYNWKYYDGGVLPRPDSYKDKPVRGLPKYRRHEKDAWTHKKALFGQNDYIDILGDGTIHPRDFAPGPAWVKGHKGNELQRIVRQFAFQADFLREHRPGKYHALSKNLFYLYKKFNRRRRDNHWQSNAPKTLSRTDKYNKSWYY